LYHSTWRGSIQYWWEWSRKARSACKDITKTSKLLHKTFDNQLAGAQCWWSCNGASDSNIKFIPNQRMATLSLHPAASRPPTSPDQWIAVKGVVKFALLKSSNG